MVVLYVDLVRFDFTLEILREQIKTLVPQEMIFVYNITFAAELEDEFQIATRADNDGMSIAEEEI